MVDRIYWTPVLSWPLRLFPVLSPCVVSVSHSDDLPVLAGERPLARLLPGLCRRAAPLPLFFFCPPFFSSLFASFPSPPAPTRPASGPSPRASIPSAPLSLPARSNLRCQ